jgi:hypothetical protein
VDLADVDRDGDLDFAVVGSADLFVDRDPALVPADSAQQPIGIVRRLPRESKAAAMVRMKGFYTTRQGLVNDPDTIRTNPQHLGHHIGASAFLTFDHNRRSTLRFIDFGCVSFSSKRSTSTTAPGARLPGLVVSPQINCRSFL